MNCFEFRKIALSDPYSESQDFVDHSISCDDCASHLAKVIETDNKIRDTFPMKAPEDMKARLKLRQVFEKEKADHRRFKRFAYAASALLTLGVAFLAVQNHQLNKQYAEFHDAALAHIQYEENSLTSVQLTAQSRMKAHLTSLLGYEVKGDLTGLRYSQLCPLKGQNTWHAVMETPSGEVVTLIYFNEDGPPKKSLNKNGWDSRVVSGKNGDLMLIGKSKNALNSIEKKVSNLISI